MNTNRLSGVDATSRANGDHPNALTVAEEALDELTTSLGQIHPHTVNAAVTVASCLSELGRRDEAAQLGARALEWSTRCQGDVHPDTLAARFNLSIDDPTIGASDFVETLKNFLGVTSPLVSAAIAGRRMELDIDLFAWPWPPVRRS